MGLQSTDFSSAKKFSEVLSVFNDKYLTMRFDEFKQDSKLVIVFKGMHGDAFPGNQQCIQLARELDASIFEYTQASNALALIKQRMPKRLVLIGYSAGVGTVMQVGNQSNPTLSIFIAGYPTTLLKGESGVKGPYINYYQPRELDGILAGRGMKPYKPQGGEPKAVDVDHANIVKAVTADIISKVKAV